MIQGRAAVKTCLRFCWKGFTTKRAKCYYIYVVALCTLAYNDMYKQNNIEVWAGRGRGMFGAK